MANLKDLSRKFHGRKDQINLLLSLLKPEDNVVPSSVFVSGLPATGKTTVVASVLEQIESNFVLINCIECYTHKLLFEPIVSKFGLDLPGGKCDNVMDLISGFVRSKDSLEFTDTVSCLVFDGVEYLTELNQNYLSVFSRLQELTGIYSLCVIFISSILPEKFSVGSSKYVHVNFPQYSKDELVEILLSDRPTDCNEQVYHNYVTAALSVFLTATRDLKEIQYLVSGNFPKYYEPIKNGTVAPSDVTGLWRHVVPHLKNSLNSVYLGFASQTTDEPAESNLTKVSTTAFDLPYYAKFFLVAAYLASYNSPKHDKRMFMKNHGKQKKTIRSMMKNDKIANELLGPKIFSLDRLLAIFYSIMSEKASLTANLMSQISTLVELRLLAKIGDGTLDKPKFRCITSFQYVDAVARTLGFNVRKYMMD